jgi:polyferredoxin
MAKIDPSARADKKSQKRARAWRWGVLLAVLVLSTGLGLAHQYVKGAGAPVGVDALCPFGGLESLYSLIANGSTIQKVAASSFILLIATVVVAVVFKRSFCGLICPLGTLQELFGRIGRRLLGGRREVPSILDRPARYLKYVVLAVFGVWSWVAAELVMRPYDPWATFHHLTSPELLAEFSVGLSVLGVTVVGSVVYDRFFCKYLCPMGALLAITSRFSIFKIKRDEATCIDCGACDRACPVNIKVSETAQVTSAECLSCNECVTACPVKDTLEVRSPAGKAWSAAKVLGVTAAIFIGITAVTTATGTFDWTTKSLAQEVRESGQEATPSEQGGTTDGEVKAFDTSLIKGRTSLKEVSEASGIPAQELMDKYKVPASDFAKPMKDIKDKYGFDPDAVRAYVEERIAKP